MTLDILLELLDVVVLWFWMVSTLFGFLGPRSWFLVVLLRNVLMQVLLERWLALVEAQLLFLLLEDVFEDGGVVAAVFD